jgi:hypothetical protein
MQRRLRALYAITFSRALVVGFQLSALQPARNLVCRSHKGSAAQKYLSTSTIKRSFSAAMDTSTAMAAASSTATAAAAPLPAIPKPAVSKISWCPAEAARLRDSLQHHSRELEGARSISRDLGRRASLCIELLHRGEMQQAREALEGCSDVIKSYKEQGLDRPELREVQGFGFEDVIAATGFELFLLTGKVVSVAHMQTLYPSFTFTGPEYIGACCNLTQELVRYR